MKISDISLHTHARCYLHKLMVNAPYTQWSTPCKRTTLLRYWKRVRHTRFKPQGSIRDLQCDPRPSLVILRNGANLLIRSYNSQISHNKLQKLFSNIPRHYLIQGLASISSLIIFFPARRVLDARNENNYMLVSFYRTHFHISKHCHLQVE